MRTIARLIKMPETRVRMTAPHGGDGRWGTNARADGTGDG